MELVSKIDDFKLKNNQGFIDKANQLRKKLKEEMIEPYQFCSNDSPNWKKILTNQFESLSFGKDDYIIFDFQHNNVGYIEFDFNYQGSHPDAPAFIELQFAEVIDELNESMEDYSGWISKSWIQVERIHIDTLPCSIKLPRRYTFRYVKVRIIDTSLKYKIKINKIKMNSVSAVSLESMTYYNNEEKDILAINEVSVRTLKNCMQDVFEDGPKRDQRLWIGDLRLQALANYYSFKDYDLVKRCLYLFAGSTFEDGRVSACLFIDGDNVEADDTYFFDYSLFFVSILYDYFMETNDMEILIDLYPTAINQLIIAFKKMNQNGIIEFEDNVRCCFIDWSEELDYQTSAQGVLIYCLKQAIALSEIMKDQTTLQLFNEKLELLIKATKEYLFDEACGLFISGKQNQISIASSVWMILAQVYDQEMNQKIINRIIDKKFPIKMVTPYMVHHFCEALIISGEKEKAMNYIKNYWGKMLELGADTFWEIFNPENPQESPYGGKIVNSYCHAWSCTPIYLFEKYCK